MPLKDPFKENAADDEDYGWNIRKAQTHNDALNIKYKWSWLNDSFYAYAHTNTSWQNDVTK